MEESVGLKKTEEHMKLVDLSQPWNMHTPRLDWLSRLEDILLPDTADEPHRLETSLHIDRQS